MTSGKRSSEGDHDKNPSPFSASSTTNSTSPFGNPAPSNSFTFGAATQPNQSVTSTPNFNFGAPTNSTPFGQSAITNPPFGAPAANNLFESNQPQASTPSFNFGAATQPNQSVTSTPPFNFGAPSTSAPAPSFGSPAIPTAGTPPVFGQMTTPSFGGFGTTSFTGLTIPTSNSSNNLAGAVFGNGSVSTPPIQFGANNPGNAGSALFNVGTGDNRPKKTATRRITNDKKKN